MVRRIISLIVTLLLFVSSSLTFVTLVQSHSSEDYVLVKGIVRTIIVPDDYSTIQAAINAANPGDTVFVKTGIYYENVVINKPVSLIGERALDTILNGKGMSNVIKVTSSNVSIKNFRITNSGNIGWNSGIEVIQSDYVNIENNIIEDNRNGIHITKSKNNIVKNNIILNNNVYGISISGHYNIIERNTIKNNTIGISFVGWYNNIFSNAIIDNKEDGICFYASQYCSISQNFISNNADDGILLTVFVTIEGEEHACLNNFISKNTIKYNRNGIGLYKALNNSIIENFLANNKNGIYINDSEHNIIYHNNFIDNVKQACFSYYSEILYNTWDNGYPSGGNFWSDYTGVDADGDGIGDTPYIIENYNIDRYPLMHLYETKGDFSPPTVRVISPNGDETLVHGSVYRIRWEATDNVGVSYINIWLLQGSEQITIIAGGIPNTGYYDWVVPDRPGSGYKIRILAADTAGNVGMDESDATFTIRIRRVDLEMHAITNSPVGDIGGKVTVHATFWNQGPDEIPAGSKYSIYIRFVDKGDKNNALNFDSIRALRDGRWEIYSSERKTFIFKDGLSVMGSKTMDFTFDIPGYDIFQTAPVIFTDTLEIIVDSEDFPDTAYYELDYRVMPSYEELFDALLTCAFRLISVEISSKVADPKFKELLLQRSENVENYMAIQMEIISLGQAASRKDLKGVIESTCKICINIARIVGKDPITLAWSFIEGVITTGRVVGHGLTLIINYMITTIYKLLGNKILGVLISSPVDFIIICKDGRRVGYRDGEILSEVEGSWVKVADHCKLALIPEDNNLVIHLYGTGKGAFSVNIISPNMQAQFTDLSAQENMKAEIYVDTIKDEFIMKKDDNGDGFYDEEINPAIYQLDGELILTKSEKRIRLIFGIPLINFLAMCALTLALIFVTVFLIYRIKRAPSSPPSYGEENKDEEKYKPIWLENHHSSPLTREKREGESMEKEEENIEWL
ncbi:MAG: NosD domain-containing protein [Candidatus Bathyarchaeia archaeon]